MQDRQSLDTSFEDVSPGRQTAPGLRQFATTQWNVVRNASEISQSDRARIEALDYLLRRYCPALVEYLKSQFRLADEQAEDLVQGFVTDKVLTKNLLGQANAARGKFRTFLLKSIQSYVLDQMKFENRLRRRPAQGFRSLEDVAEAELATVPQQAEDEFNNSFARQVVTEAIHRTHQTCLNDGKLDLWEILHARVIAPILEGTEPEDYETLVADLGLASVAAAHSKLASGKRIFKRAFRGVIEEFAADEKDLREEIAFLENFFE